MVWYGMVWYGMVWYDKVWYGMVWYGHTPRSSGSHTDKFTEHRNTGRYLALFGKFDAVEEEFNAGF